MDKFVRTFHPVGQGAFYTEEYKDISLVNDCGTISKRKSAKKCIKKFSKDKSKLDVLCVSHFDLDHVNLIPYLKDAFPRIDYVFLPLLSSAEKTY